MKQKMILAMVASLAAFMLLSQAAPRRADSNQSDSNADARRLKTLLVERRDIIKQRLEIVRAQRVTGQSNTEEIALVQDRLFMAELALATKKPQRVQILESRVKNLKQLEVYSKRMFETGVHTVEKVLDAREQRLGAEIDLYRAKIAK